VRVGRWQFSTASSDCMTKGSKVDRWEAPPFSSTGITVFSDYTKVARIIMRLIKGGTRYCANRRFRISISAGRWSVFWVLVM
jgi:hypothetical protein